MESQVFLETDRLSLFPMSPGDAAFILELVNTPGWIQFIGDRNVHSLADASAYIERILSNPDISYWVAKEKSSGAATGVITFIQRNYLPNPDIGFAFLPSYFGSGYAFEAANAVLKALVQERKPVKVLATTLPSNISSIRLLQKLGFQLEKEIPPEQGNHADLLHVYARNT